MCRLLESGKNVVIATYHPPRLSAVPARRGADTPRECMRRRALWLRHRGVAPRFTIDDYRYTALRSVQNPRSVRIYERGLRKVLPKAHYRFEPRILTARSSMCPQMCGWALSKVPFGCSPMVRMAVERNPCSPGFRTDATGLQILSRRHPRRHDRRRAPTFRRNGRR